MMPEKSASELFNEEVAFRKEANDAHDKLDEVEKEIGETRNQIDALRTKIRNLEEEARAWKRVVRTKKYLADKANKAAWATKASGL